MNARFLRPNVVLPYNVRKRMERDIESEQRRLQGPSDDIPNRFKKFMDEKFREQHPEIIKRNIKRLKSVLSRGSPDSLSKREKVAKEQMIAEDKEWLQRHMVPKSHYNVGWRDIQARRITQKDYDKVVQGCLGEHSPEFKKRSLRFKNNMREIDPDNPNASNLEEIRPD